MARSLIKLCPLLVVAMLWGCHSTTGESHHEHLKPPALPDTLYVGTLYGPTTYFEYRDQIMGYDYALARKLARDKNMELKFVVGSSLPAMVEQLDSGIVDIIAAPVPQTAEFLSKTTPCAYVSLSSQVLVQKKGSELIDDVTQLVGKDVYVENDSKFYHRLQNLNEELGGGINIHILDKDSIIAEDLLEMVSAGEIPYTIVDSDVARLNKTYFPGLDISIELSFPQKSSWAVAKRNSWLADSIDAWYEETEPQEDNGRLLRRYFELTRTLPLEARDFSRNFNKGYISSYDNLFKKYAGNIDWDWRLMAAMCYSESKFDNSVVSWAGARGIMQIMPATARAFGSTADKMIIPEESVRIASKIIESLNRSLSSDVPDPAERVKFIVAAYNSGLAHVKDAIEIAKAYGYNPQVWNGNVAEAMKMKSKPEIFNNTEICKYGYFRGTYTTAYVNSVMNLYNKALANLRES